MTELPNSLGSVEALADYIGRQLNAISPIGPLADDIAAISALIGPCAPRILSHVQAVKQFRDGTLDVLNSLQHAAFLYILSREASVQDARLADRIFLVNKALNCIDLYHRIDLSNHFFISHGSGAVIGAATYGTHLVIFQNVTVGRVGDRRPVIGARVVLYPGACVTGSAVIGDDCVISANVAVHNIEVPARTLVSRGPEGLSLTPLQRDYNSLYFNL